MTVRTVQTSCASVTELLDSDGTVEVSTSIVEPYISTLRVNGSIVGRRAFETQEEATDHHKESVQLLQILNEHSAPPEVNDGCFYIETPYILN